MYKIGRSYKLEIRAPFNELILYTATILEEDTNSIRFIDKKGQELIIKKEVIIRSRLIGDELNEENRQD